VVATLAGCSATQMPSAPATPTTPQEAKATTSTAVTASSTSTTIAAATQNIVYDTSASISYAVGAEPGNWDIHAAGASSSYLTLQQVLAQVWPSAFYVGTNGTPTLNTSLLTSATVVSSDPQTVVYQINSRAIWSDGTPITYADFAYNWEAQSGKASFRDLGGAAYAPLDQAGYDDVSSVQNAHGDPYTVRVTFSSPYSDWQSLFDYLVPAHVGRSIGFDSGFTDPVADLVSGGPYLVSELQPGYSLELVRNARYWGTPANLSAVTYYFTSGTAETIDALSDGQLGVAVLQAEPSAFKQLQATGGLSVRAVASNLYEDLDFNQAGPPLSSPVLRRAIMMALDRGGMATEVLAPYGLAATPVENRAYLAGDPGYTDDGTDYDAPSPTAAIHLLTSNGYTLSAGLLHDPAGKPLNLSLQVQAADPVAQQLADEVATSCAAIGVVVRVSQTGPPAGDLVGAGTFPPLPAGWQMAIELRSVPAFGSAIASRYAAGGGANVDGYANATMSGLLDQLGAATPAQLAPLYDAIDKEAWAGSVDLPLVQLPMVMALNSKLLNVEVGPYFSNLAWDQEDWGFGVP
jgi:peptide/nickel transport system substrate-binding protein